MKFTSTKLTADIQLLQRWINYWCARLSLCFKNNLSSVWRNKDETKYKDGIEELW